MRYRQDRKDRVGAPFVSMAGWLESDPPNGDCVA